MSEIEKKYQNPAKQARYQTAMERQAERNKRTPEQQLERLGFAPGESKRERNRLMGQVAQKSKVKSESVDSGSAGESEKKTRKLKKN